MSAVPAGQTAWQKYSPHLFHTGVRITFWALAVIIAFAPSVFASHHLISLSIVKMGSEANEALLFRDFYYIVIVVSILEITNIWERISHNHTNTLLWARSVFIMAGAYFIYTLFTGTMEFMNLAQARQAIPTGPFNDDLSCIRWVLSVSFITELTCGLVGPR